MTGPGGSRGTEAASGYDVEQAAGPDCLGRSVLVLPGQPAPAPWEDCPRVRVDAESPDAATGRRLRSAWHGRERLVIEVDGSLPGAEPVLDRPWWELAPGLTLGDEVWHHLLTANTVDARDPDRLRFAPRERALDAGARSASPGQPGDVVTQAGGLWCDGGPLDCFNASDLDGAALIPAANLAVDDLGGLQHGEPVADLAPDQRRAVGHLGGAACIVAPAGSGKTRVLTERARWLVRGLGVAPTAVCLVAYNVRARAEMQERTADLEGLEVRTLNSLALALCNGSGPCARPAVHDRVEVIGERDVRDLLHGLVGERAPRRRRRAMTDPLAPWVEALSACRLGLRDPAEVERDYAPDIEGFAELAPAYAEALDERGVVDFDHQIVRAIDVLLTDPAARTAARRVCGLLLVDEFQDLTPAHLLMIRLLAGPRADVFGVGDDDQTIYGYSGASPRWLIEYERFFPGAARHLLGVNYRCPPAVVEAASNLLSHNRHRIAKDISTRPARARETASLDVGEPDGAVSEAASEAVSPDGSAPDADESGRDRVAGRSLAVEAAGDGGLTVVERVRTLMAAGAEARDIAVLTRVNSTLLAPQVLLSEAGIDCMAPVGPWFLERTGVAAALAWLRLATSDTARLPAGALAIAARRPPRGISPRVIDWMAEQHNVGALRRLAGRISDERTSQRVEDFADDVERLGDMARDGADTLRLLEAVRDGTQLGAILDERLDASRRSVDRSAHGDDLRALMSVAPHCRDPAAFEDWLRDRLTDGDEGDARLGRPSWGRGVRLATVHRVKGLEWPHVIVLSATEGLMPHRLAGDIEEERRVFHVAITRGSESVLVVADGPKSPFITEMQWRSNLGPTDPLARPAQARLPASAEPSSPARRDAPSASSRAQSPPIDEAAEPEAASAFERLRQWRLDRSKADGVPAFVVSSDATLRELARRRPSTDEALLAVPGIGPAKLAAYGEALKSLLTGPEAP
ncbi:MAG: ATP-dependent DNA helicase UvrD2 [Acidimicrobiaceae bacterium]|nr:ATP-dependent DNA helicase UvrD2 [Acidimicrobiaceae bacterium]MYE98377.1 ATP-dependent DNA helicase UvrD2 [Acidimicrobiaceae bacterium]MYI54694.1 ATP-dependent DNA helicase UvrD2 [Acidimicrobiaceae bacterium]